MRTTANMSEGTIWKHLARFALPVLLGNLMQQLYNVVDTMMVGRALGVDALAAVGATGNIMFFFYALMSGVSVGVSIIISQYYGARDIKQLRLTFGTSIFAMAGIVAITTGLGLAFRRPLLSLLSTPESIFEMADGYIVIIIGGLCVNALYNWISSILRAMGNSMIPLLFLAVSAVLNIFFNYLFIIALGWGVNGAAWGTIVAQLISGVTCLLYALHVSPELRVTREEIRWNSRIAKNIALYGIPAGLQTAFISISIMAMQSVVNGYGAVVTAAFSVCSKIENFCMLAGNAIGMAVGTFVGQNTGAGQSERVKKCFWVATGMVACVCLILSPLLMLCADSIVNIFIDDSSGAEAAQMIAIGGVYVRTFACFLFCVGVLNILQNLLRASGDIGMTMAMGGWEIVTRVAVSFTLSALLGMNGIWWATPITWTTTMLWGLARFLSGKWQNRSVTQKKIGEEQPA